MKMLGFLYYRKKKYEKSNKKIFLCGWIGVSLHYQTNTSTMTKVKTTPELAASILDTGNRKITTEKNENVFWININNQTLLAGNKKSSRLYNCEDVELYIHVPSRASKVF